MSKVFYDDTTGKQVSDTKGVHTIASVKAQFGMTDAVQEITLTPEESIEVINGVLSKFNKQDRTDARVAAQEANRLGKETATRAKLGLSASEFEDLKVALS